jgi:Tol biopolymer transport system component
MVEMPLRLVVFSAALAILWLAPGSLPAPMDGLGRNGRIVFTSDRDGNRELYLLRGASSAQTRLTNNSFGLPREVADFDPAWSAIGIVAFVRDLGDGGDIYSIVPDTRARKQLTANPAADTDPAWSPAGSKFAFTTTRDGNPEIYLGTLVSPAVTNLSRHPAEDTQAAWSPAGTEVAFVTNRDGNREIYVMSEDGAEQRNLTNNPADDSDPDWSPNGSQIAFTRRTSVGADVYVMDANGGNQHLLPTPSGDDLEPAWSPDGRLLAFASTQDGDFEIYVMYPDGSYQRDFSNSRRAADREPDWETLPPAGSEAARPAPQSIDLLLEPCTIQKRRKSDTIRGSKKSQVICAGGGNDTIYGGGGQDQLRGEAGNDRLFVRDGRGDDVVFGGVGRDCAVVDRGDEPYGVESLACRKRPRRS